MFSTNVGQRYSVPTLNVSSPLATAQNQGILSARDRLGVNLAPIKFYIFYQVRFWYPLETKCWN